MGFDSRDFGRKKSGSGFNFFLIAIAVLFVVYVVLQSNPVAIDNEGSSGLFSLGSIMGGNDYKKDVIANQVDSYFCPEEECAQKMISRIDSAQKSIYIAIYSFTHDGIAGALLKAKDRGVQVKVVFDYDQSKNDYSEDEKLSEAGIEIKRRDGSGYMHNKFIVIDEEVVGTGSFNYSDNADKKNDENLIFIVSKDLAVRFIDEFNELWEQALK